MALHSQSMQNSRILTLFYHPNVSTYDLVIWSITMTSEGSLFCSLASVSEVYLEETKQYFKTINSIRSLLCSQTVASHLSVLSSLWSPGLCANGFPYLPSYLGGWGAARAVMFLVSGPFSPRNSPQCWAFLLCPGWVPRLTLICSPVSETVSAFSTFLPPSPLLLPSCHWSIPDIIHLFSYK